MTKPIRDLPASIRQRLNNVAKERHRPAAELLQYFAMERFLYRLAQSPHRDHFVLKGAMMLVAWRAPTIRPTMDIDLLGRGRHDTADLVELPTILDFPAPRLTGYSRETAIALKLNAMFQHGRLNSRMKDYFDIGLLARSFDFEGAKLARAIRATFERRGTALVATPIGLSDEFATEPGKQGQWTAFLRKIQVTHTHAQLAAQVVEVRAFLGPVLSALVDGASFERQWPKGGPWT